MNIEEEVLPPGNSIVPFRQDINTDKAEIVPVATFLRYKLKIPEYQRPYKWEERHVTQLIEDIYTHRYKKKYRLGSIVIHMDGNTLNIVDGQQRFTTLRIMLYALADILEERRRVDNTDIAHQETEKYIKTRLIGLKQSADEINIEYSRLSEGNIRQNYRYAKQLLRRYDSTAIRFFLDNCELVVFYIKNISEAFQLFDSQNSRGKELYPHDLLKAFHLREFTAADADHRTHIVAQWENYPSEEVSLLFSTYLYRIKRWSAQKGAGLFTKQHIGMFKGVNVDKTESYPFVKGLHIAHRFTDNYNNSFERTIDKQVFTYPFQLDSVIINGRRFFEYVNHYKNIIDTIKRKFNDQKDKISDIANEQTPEPIELVYYNKKGYRDGEKYLQTLFECLVVYYVDKFGYAEFNAFTEKAFVWCYCLRFDYQRLGFYSLDKYVLENNFFCAIKDAINPSEVLNFNIRNLPAKAAVEKFAEEKDQTRMDDRIPLFFIQRMYYGN